MLRVCRGLLLVSLFGCLLVGCSPERKGPETAKVTGLVTLDGEPVEGAMVNLIPSASGHTAYAQTDKKGKFRIHCQFGDGAVPGSYGIMVIKQVQEGGVEFENQAAVEAYIKEHGKRPPRPKTVDKLPNKYANPETSGFKTEIALTAKNYLELALESE